MNCTGVDREKERGVAGEVGLKVRPVFPVLMPPSGAASCY